MKRGVIWIVLTCLTLTSLVLVSCTTSSTTSTPASTTTTTTKTTTTKTSTTTATQSTTIPQTTTTTTTGNWWDKLGTPQYGGEVDLRTNKDIAGWDPYFATSLFSINSAYEEELFSDDWTLDPAIFAYNIDFRPSDYVAGHLAESWEFANPGIFVVHLRQGIHWQNILPANGREFIADDVVFHYNRLLGLGSGYLNKPSPAWGTDSSWAQLMSVTTTDKYTVVFKWKTNNPEWILETVQAIGGANVLTGAPEAVQQWGDVNDWHHTIGTGPFILKDFVSGSSATLVSNPDYWGYDERYPQNRLPYVDAVKFLIIPDNATALAALRTGKIDFVDGITLQDVQSTQKTNPQILQAKTVGSYGKTIDPRNDVKPFNDIRVREAMQMAIDLPTIAATFYGGTVSPNPLPLTSNYMTGYGFPYEQWPQDLKDQYAYNPTQAKALLAAAGYTNGFNTDCVADNSGDLDLLQILQSYFAVVGINMEIRTMDPASWTLFVKSGHKQDQLAHKPTVAFLGENIEPMRQLAGLLANTTTNYIMVNDPTYNGFYTSALATTSVADMKKVLRDANEYVARQHFVISLLQPMNSVLYQPWLKGYSGQAKSILGTGSAQFGFFLGRFWIDQKLKTSMGH